MAARFQTGRGTYTLAIVRNAGQRPEKSKVTLALENADGLERIAFEYELERALMDPMDESLLADKLTPWVISEFERLREAALKSIRSERRLLRVKADGGFRGRF